MTVRSILHLPFPSLALRRIQVHFLDLTEEELDWTGQIAVGRGQAYFAPNALEAVTCDTRLVIFRPVYHDDSVSFPTWTLSAQQDLQFLEEAAEDLLIRVDLG
jgi:hypothetical protein